LLLVFSFTVRDFQNTFYLIHIYRIKGFLGALVIAGVLYYAIFVHNVGPAQQQHTQPATYLNPNGGSSVSQTQARNTGEREQTKCKKTK
jgi:hypothetical protein